MNVKETLETIYTLYPRREGKKQGMQRLLKEIKTEEQLKQFHDAVVNYAELCRQEQRERQYIKHWSTFANCWEDYVDAEALGLKKKTEERFF